MSTLVAQSTTPPAVMDLADGQSVTLTPDQKDALDAFADFYTDPAQSVFLLTGYSGCGKTTLIKVILSWLPDVQKTAKLLTPGFKSPEVMLTATTNKAAENFARLTGEPVCTIHSLLSLRVKTNFRDNTSQLIPSGSEKQRDLLLFIDEASYIDQQLLDYIFRFTENCKIVFIGDPAQLTPVKSSGVPVFDAGYHGAQLTTVVRQEGEGVNPIIDLSTLFRNTVNTGEFFQFEPDGDAVVYLDQADFNQALEDEFTRSDWKFSDSKILAWTNKRVIGYNHFVRNLVTGDPDFQEGDYAVCNSFMACDSKRLKTDQMVCIEDIEPLAENHGVRGHWMTLENGMRVFHAQSLSERNARIKAARDADEKNVLRQMEERWIDLRAAYACTVNKAQGSTFDKVFIDLDDIGRCNSGEQIARMLYVAVSRARSRVVLTGDIVRKGQ